MRPEGDVEDIGLPKIEICAQRAVHGSVMSAFFSPMQARAGGSADGGDGGICPAAGGRGWGHEPGSGSVYHLFVRKVGICGSELARFLGRLHQLYSCTSFTAVNDVQLYN